MLSSTYSYISTQLRVTHKFAKWLTHLAHFTFTFVQVLYSIKTETRQKHCGIQISLWWCLKWTKANGRTKVRNIWGFFSSRSLKTREKYISFAQFVYFLREVCLLFNFIIQKLKSKHTSLKNIQTEQN